MKTMPIQFISKKSIPNYNLFFKKAQLAHDKIINKSDKGSNFLGWVDIPINNNSSILKQIENDIERLKNKIQALVVIGIGGSYLGAKAIIEALKPSTESKTNIKILYAGHQINGLYIYNLLKKLDGLNYAIAVISKSGTTTEPAIAFRIIRKHLQDKYGIKEANERIIAITDGNKGTLFNIATKNKFSKYIIPDDVGGRYSVLTPVGLLPIAFAGYDIKALLQGAKEMALTCRKQITELKEIDENPAMKYAIIRNYLYANNYSTELMVSYYDELSLFAEWWKQLYGESEGKDGKGIFPASVNFTTDLHSLGQFIQGGTKNLFETVLHIEKISNDIIIAKIDEDDDKLNYLAGKSLHQINNIAEKATIKAHTDGGVENIIINIEKIDEYNLGRLIYFFEYACAISAYMIDVNPFNQPDVEQYKQNMFKMLLENKD